MNKVNNILKKPKSIILHLIYKGYFNFLPDKIYLKILYKLKIGKKLNLDNPKTFNEKLQWLKLYDRKDIYTKMVDKYKAKKYVAKIIGDEYIIPTLGVYEKFDDINFDELPNQFVIKCTHDSGGIVIVKNKDELNIDEAKKIINRGLQHNYYYSGREWPYKNVKPRIIVEKYLENVNRDYRLYCFEGNVKYIYSYVEENNDIDKPEPKYCDIYDENWNKQDFRQMCFPSKNGAQKPSYLDMMIKIANKLSRDMHFLRVDFFIVNGRLYIGELTFYPGSGMSKFFPEEWDNRLGLFIDLK